MPSQAFEVIVGQPESIDSERVAIAESARYLAYSDQTDTFGYHGAVFEVNVFGGGDGEGWGIGLQFDAVISSDDELKAFMDEMAQLSKVESVERVSYER